MVFEEVGTQDVGERVVFFVECEDGAVGCTWGMLDIMVPWEAGGSRTGVCCLGALLLAFS